jgi:hypothetical protein
VVWGSNKSVFSNVDPCALPRASGRGVVTLDGPPRVHRPIWRGFTPRSQIRRTNSFAMPTNEVLRRGAERGAAAARWLKGGTLHGASQAPSGSPPSPSLAPTSDPKHTTGLKDQSAMWPGGGRSGALSRQRCVGELRV